MLLLACKEISLSYLLPYYMSFADPKNLKPLVRESFRSHDLGTETALLREAA
jgi:hypothetical protein